MCLGSLSEAPIGAGVGSWVDQVRWRTAEGALLSPSKTVVSRRHLLKLAIAAEVKECVGALQKEY